LGEGGTDPLKNERTENNMTPEQLNADFEARYKAEVSAGGSVEIDHGLPFVAVTLSNGDEYVFQGDEAANLLGEVPDFMNEKVFILASAQNW
jgi:hypothetical protein